MVNIVLHVIKVFTYNNDEFIYTRNDLKIFCLRTIVRNNRKMGVPSVLWSQLIEPTWFYLVTTPLSPSI